MVRGCCGIAYKARYQSVSFEEDYVGKGDILVGYSMLSLFRVSGVSNVR